MQLPWKSVVVLLGVAWSTAAVEKEQTKPYNVAIIGAGAAGSSAAYHLRQYAQQEGVPINITIFEKTEHIGGRTLTVDAFGDELQPIELGASIFVTVNQIMYNATIEFGLSTKDPHDIIDGSITAIWDGQRFVFETAEGSSWWWDAAKMFWKYGLAPYRAVKLVKQVVSRFMQLYEEPQFPFRSLTQRAYELGLEQITGVTGEQFLAANKIDARFGRDILQAATRVNYASNLAFIHGLETMVSFATDGAQAVHGGNWQIFEQMAVRSGASIQLNTSVASLSLAEGKGEDSPPEYHITTKDSGKKEATVEDYALAFDKVVIASPWQFSNIDAGDGVLQHKIDEIPYTKLHVTLFTSPLKLKAEYFGLEPGSTAPSTVYTTLSEEEEPKQGAEGVGRTGFYSISTLKTVTNPKTEKTEYAYKIFSAKPVTSEFLTAILGAEIPDTFVSKQGSARTASIDDSSSSFEPISWYYPHYFYSYPIELPRVTFQDPVVGDGLFYTSGIESFISTMETSALMGKNVARLIADEFTGVSRDDPAKDESDYVFVETPETGEEDSTRQQGTGEL